MDFDKQATGYNKRAGFPDEAIAPIVTAICELIPDAGKAVLLELGAGTGTLGVALAKQVGRYIGMDQSGAMLKQATSSDGPAPEINMVVADASKPWPIESALVQCFFTSRALHLFDLDNVCSELQRTADPAAAIFLVGRVERDRDSLHSILRREMRRRLQEAGYIARDGQRAWQQMGAFLAQWNGQILPSRTVASWQRSRSPAQMLSAWESKPGLGGLSIPSEEKAALLSNLGLWAKKNWYNDFDKICEIKESYVLRGMTFQTSSHKE